MAYRYGERNQAILFPQSIEEYISPHDPVRAYDAFVEALGFKELGLTLDPDKVGNSEYDPKAMLKLHIYGPSYGIRSSRKLERAVYHNNSFIWLMGGLKPDHKTISKFRKDNKEVLKKFLKQCARLCLKLNLIEGNTLFTDGSKIRANASVKNTWDKKKCKKILKRIDERIEAIMAECDAIDEQEKDAPSLVRMEEELKDKETLKAKVQEILKELEEDNKKSINTTDSDCTRINSIQGSHAGYNAQITVDDKHGLIVNSDAVSENNDLYQFANQINQSNETLGKKCDTACADSGYATTDELKKIVNQEIKVIVPSQRQAAKKEPGQFDKENFRYDAQNDCYICPEGHVLNYRYTDETQNSKVYKFPNSSICSSCPHFGICTKSKNGRTVTRLVNEEVRQKLELQYEQPESQKIYKRRKEKAELPFGHFKQNLGVRTFLLKGRDGAKAEISLLSTCFNVARMITILGVSGLIQQLMR